MIQGKYLKRFIIYFVLLTLPGVLWVPSATAAFKYLHEGMKIPEVSGINVYDNQKVSSEVYLSENNMLIIVFWATWSKRSIDELEALKEIANENTGLKFKIIAVNVEGQDLTPAAKTVVQRKTQELDLPFPAINDESLSIFYSFGVIAVPSTAITDTTGVMRFGPAGFSLTTRDLIEDSIKVLLGLEEAPTIVAVKGYKPNNKSRRYYNLALNLTFKRMYERALSNIDLAVEADSKFPSPYSLRGEIFSKTDKTTLAIESYTKAVSLDSEFVAAKAGLGHAYLQANQLDSAFHYLQATLKLDDSYTPAFLDLGLCLSQMGKDQEALDSLKSAQELNARNPLPYYYMGKVYLKLSDTTSAVTQLIKALKLFYPSK